MLQPNDITPQVYQKVRQYAMRLTDDRSTVEDLVQQTLLHAWQARNTYQRKSQLTTWLWRILHNLHVSHVRHQNFVQSAHRRYVSHAKAHGVPSNPDPVERIRSKRSLQAISEYLERARAASPIDLPRLRPGSFAPSGLRRRPWHWDQYGQVDRKPNPDPAGMRRLI